MKRKDLLTEVIKRIQRNEYLYQIKKYLASKGITEEIQNEILTEAKAGIKAEQTKKLPVKNKTIFSVFLSLTILTFILFMFVFPQYDIYNYTTLLSVLGVILFIIFGVMSFIYYKRWTPERVALEIEGKITSNYTVAFATSIIPAIILFFILFFRFAAVEDRILEETQVRTVGKIISGLSKRSGGSSSSTIIVQFTTKEGNFKKVKLEVGGNEFNSYYKDQKVNIVYSSRYPSIVKLLTQEEEIRKFTDAEERDLLPTDLEAIIAQEFIPSVTGLNKISLGWIKDRSSGSWQNENRNTAIRILDDEEVAYLCDYEGSKTFTNALIKNGYKEIKGKSKLGGIIVESKNYENDDYVVFLETKITEGNIISVIQMSKK
jgi:hypothetical protein